MVMTHEWKEPKPGQWQAQIGPFTASVLFRSGGYDASLVAEGPEVNRGPGGPTSAPRCFMAVPSHYEVMATTVHTGGGLPDSADTKHLVHHFTLAEIQAECVRYAHHLAQHVLRTADAWRSSQ